MRVENLTAKRQKSYYGKAKVIFADDGAIMLKSYDTIVAKIENGIFVKMWGGYSATTMKHINDFCDMFNINGGGKKWWDNLPCQCDTCNRYRIVLYNGIGMTHKCPAIYDTWEQACKELDRISENLNPFWFADIEEVNPF